MAHSSQWFSRKQTAGDLEASVFDSGRQCEFVNANGEDVRYKQPGLRWELFKEIRKETYSDYTGRLQSVFDEFYERVTKRGRTAQPRDGSQSPVPVFPTIKTPAISKSRSRTRRAKTKSPVPVPESVATEPQTEVVEFREATSITDITNTPTTKTTTKSPSLKARKKPLTSSPVRPNATNSEPMEVPASSTRRSVRLRTRAGTTRQVKTSNARTRPMSTRSKKEPVAKDTNLDQECPFQPPKDTQPTEVAVSQPTSCATPPPMSREIPKSPVQRKADQEQVEKVTVSSVEGNETERDGGTQVRMSLRLRKKGGAKKMKEVGTSKINTKSEHTTEPDSGEENPVEPSVETTEHNDITTAPLTSERTSSATPITNEPPHPVEAERACVENKGESPRREEGETVAEKYESRLVEVGETYVKKHRSPLVVKVGETCVKSKPALPCPVEVGKTYVKNRDSPHVAGGVSCVNASPTLADAKENLPPERRGLRAVGKVISMNDLRKLSPLLTKTVTKKKVATPTTQTKSEASTVLSPSKIPRLRSSGVKRLRSVSLERLSSSHMTKAKKSSCYVDSTSDGSSDDPGSSGDDQDATPTLIRMEVCDSGSDTDHISTPREGAGSGCDSDELDDLPLTPRPHPLERVVKADGFGGSGELKERPKSGNKTTHDFLLRLFDKKYHKDNHISSAGKATGTVSLIPARNSPREIESTKRQEKLAEKIQRKREEEERRCEELKVKKQLEIEEKKKKREEKMKRVAENQAALKRQEMEKKKKLESKKDQVEKLNQKKARQQADQQAEKHQKLRDKMLAAETRRKEEEEAAKKRARVNAVSKKGAEDPKKRLQEAEDPKKRLQELLVGVVGKLKARAPMASSVNTGSDDDVVERIIIEEETSEPTDALNSTFTKDGAEEHATVSCTPANSHYHLMAGSALAAALAVKNDTMAAEGPQSYIMTPAENDPLFMYENYDIGNLSSDDSTDDEDCPKKTIPAWANPQTLATVMLDQEAALEANCIDINQIFPPEQLLQDINLSKIFKLKRRRFYQRSSSAQWNSPLYKRSRLE